jgi:hypothetical protein
MGLLYQKMANTVPKFISKLIEYTGMNVKISFKNMLGLVLLIVNFRKLHVQEPRYEEELFLSHYFFGQIANNDVSICK